MTLSLAGTTAPEPLLRLEQARRSELAQHVTAYGIYRIDPDGRIGSWNIGAERLTGLPAAAVIGKPYAILMAPESQAERVPTKALSFAREYNHVCEEHERRKADGSTFTARISLDTARDEGGQIIGFVEVFSDVTEDKARERALYQRATQDALTGVFNRGHFTELARQEIDRARRFFEPLSLAVMDVDHFKSINDRFGHAAGDEALIQLARAVTGFLRRIDVFGRIGGEEFALLLPRASLGAAEELLNQLRLHLSTQVIDLPPDRFQFTVSIGVAQLSSELPDLPSLLRSADAALYRAKHEGRNQVQAWRGKRPT